MKTNSRKNSTGRHILFILMAAMMMNTSSAAAQSVIKYGYDAAGNRIWQRSNIYTQERGNRLQRLGGSSEDSPQTVASNLIIGGKAVKVMTMKEPARLRIDILELEDSDNSSAAMFTVAGQQLFSRALTNQSTTIDISSYRAGIYVIQVVLNGEQASWRIIKR